MKREIAAAFVSLCSLLIAAYPPIGWAADASDDSAAAVDSAPPAPNPNAVPPEDDPPVPATPENRPDAYDTPPSSEVPLATSQAPTDSGPSVSIPPTADGTPEDPVVNYQQAQSPPPYDAGLNEQYMMEDENDLPLLGVEVRLDRRKLKSGEMVSGLLVLGVSPGSPAAVAGLQGFSHKITSAVETVAMAAAMVLPVAAPAAMIVPVLESSHVGEHYDLIVAIDGNRVTNLVDLQDAVRDAQPGETTYLSIIRDGKRLQVPVKLQKVSLMPQYAP